MRRIKLIIHRLLRRFSLLSEQKQLLVLSIVVGLASGFVALLLKSTIYLIKYLLTSWFNATEGSLLYLAYPGIGILITVLYVRYFVKDSVGHGITKVLYAISRNRSKLKSKFWYTPIIASSFTIGFGGSAGAQAPVVLASASIGSTIGKFFRLNYRSITLLLGCGAAGAVAGMFKAPMAGIVFTLEILMLDLTISSIVPLLASSVSAASVAYFFTDLNFNFSASSIQTFSMGNIPFYILLGIFCGFAALYFTRVTIAIEGRFKKILNPYRKWLVGAVTIGVLIFFIPPLYGEGYDIISALLNGRSDEVFARSLFFGLKDSYIFMFVYLALILVFKVVAMAVTNSSGGVGGTFGPTLFMGGIAGFFIARGINVSGIHQVPEANFTLVGMGGMMAAVMHAPLTAIFLIAEITGGYTLFMPLIITSIVSFTTIRAFEKHSILTKRLAIQGDLITHNKDKAALTMLTVSDLIETDFIPVHPTNTLKQLVKAISKSKRNIFPVINTDGTLAGVVLMDNIRKIMFEPSKYDVVLVEELMEPPLGIVADTDSIDCIIERFEETRAWNLPIVNEQNRYVGFLSKSRILTAYRNVLMEFSED